MKHLTISDIEAQSSREPIWALNNSANVRAAGDLILSVPKMNGAKVDALTLPSSWLAISLTEQIPRQQLLASSEFRQAVTRNLIILISADDAQRINAQEGAAEERERLLERERRVAEAMQSKVVHGLEDTLVTTTAPATEMDPGFIIFFEALGDKGDIETLNQLRTRARFRRSELEYVARNLIEKPKAVTWCREQLELANKA